MTTILSKIEQFLDSNDIEGAREEVAQISINLRRVDTTVRDFAALLALGSENILEISLGVLGRKLLNNRQINDDVLWLLLAAVLSRQTITSNSPSRISILGLVSCVDNWKLPIFALLTPALDAFLKVSLSEGNPLIAEQTLDFISTWGESYAQAPHLSTQLTKLQSLTQLLLDKVDDLDIKEEWTEGLELFFQTAGSIKYSDENIWSASGKLLKKIYDPKNLNKDIETNNPNQVKDNIFRLITSSLAAIRTILGQNGLSIAVRIDNLKEKNLWSVGAGVIDKLERLLQEIADVIFHNITKLPAFTPPQSVPGSWTIILQMDITSAQSNLLANAISSLSSKEDASNETNSLIAHSWKECVLSLKEDDLKVELAVSTHNPELNVTRAISTEDIPDVEDSGLSPNIRILSRDVPQGNSLERVIEFASLLIQYPSSLSTVRQKFLERNKISKRTFAYHRRSAEILGLANERDQPTNDCYMLDRLPTPSAKIRLLAYKFISSNVGSAWFKWQNANDLAEIQPERAAEFLIAVCPSLSEKSTVQERAETLKSWVKKFQKEF